MKEMIRRITYMETIFDEVQKAFAEGEPIREDALKELIRYYESEQWKEDYASDERGELPAELKRGVLSEDGVYHLLCELEDLQKKN